MSLKKLSGKKSKTENKRSVKRNLDSGSKRLIIKDVARYTGFSIATVSRVLNESGVYYSQKTYQKVRDAIKALTISGIKIPEQMSIVGFDGIEISRYVNPALTTVVQPRFEMGN